jgi:hypothetical protein
MTKGEQGLEQKATRHGCCVPCAGGHGHPCCALMRRAATRCRYVALPLVLLQPWQALEKEAREELEVVVVGAVTPFLAEFGLRLLHRSPLLPGHGGGGGGDAEAGAAPCGAHPPALMPPLVPAQHAVRAQPLAASQCTVLDGVLMHQAASPPTCCAPSLLASAELHLHAAVPCVHARGPRPSSVPPGLLPQLLPSGRWAHLPLGTLPPDAPCAPHLQAPRQSSC